MSARQQPNRPDLAAHDRAQATLTTAGYECTRADGEIPGVRRFHTRDPFGNRIEFQQT
jgi:hypothetical protein